MDKGIFRKVSLERLSSPEQLDLMITVTSPKGWLGLVAIGLIILTVVIWSVFGTIPTRVYGQGILMKSGGVRNVVHISEGMITDIRVVPGDIVSPGDVIARIDQHEQVVKILEMEKQLEKLEKGHDSNDSNDSNEEEFNKNKERIVGMENDIANLREELEYNSFIVSPYSGCVLEVKMNKGDMLEPGVPVVSVELIGNAIKELEAIIYISAEQGKKVYPGMEVQISPTTVKKEEYGFLLGRVISVSEYPSTRQGMLSVLGSEEMVDKLMGSNAPIEVHADLVPGSGTESGYKWSSPKGPPSKINSGTLCTASVTIKNEPPIKKVLPIR